MININFYLFLNLQIACSMTQIVTQKMFMTNLKILNNSKTSHITNEKVYDRYRLWFKEEKELRRITKCGITELAGCFLLILLYVPLSASSGLIPISGITGEIIIKLSGAVKAAPCVSGAYLRETQSACSVCR